VGVGGVYVCVWDVCVCGVYVCVGVGGWVKYRKR
jgi:hypothetical protein